MNKDLYKEDDLVEFETDVGTMRGYIIGISPKHPVPYEVAVDGVQYPRAALFSRKCYKFNINCQNPKYLGFWMFLLEHEFCTKVQET